MPKKEVDEILSKYRKRLEKHIDIDTLGEVESTNISEFSQEYTTFREEWLSKSTTTYENFCNTAEKIFPLKPASKDEIELSKAIKTAHLQITPSGAVSFAALIGGLFVILGLLIAGLDYGLTPDQGIAGIGIFLPLLFITFGLIALKIFAKYPTYLATKWRLKASNQMVLCILYVVMYMRHTSNLEHAIKFSAQHIDAPLSLDLMRIFWNIETSKFSNIKDSLNDYLEFWREYNLDFVTSFHLIQSSLYEPTESRRIDLLDKSLNVILEGTYEKMLNFAHILRNPITTLHMLGVILPILGLVMFPLIGSFLGGLVKWYHLAFLYNLVLPIIVFGYGTSILSKRPTGYGESKVLQKQLEERFNPLGISIFLALFLFFIGLIPIILHTLSPGLDYELPYIGLVLNYVSVGTLETTFYGPFGLGALILSFFIPFGIATAIGFYYKTRSKGFIELREETKKLEKEFSAALFQLGNRIADGIPVEMAFSRIAENMQGTPTGDFFRTIDINIRTLGISVREAIFSPEIGAINKYPSSLIESSMEVLLESSKKSPQIAARSMISISNYVDRIYQVNQRLQDLLAEITSSMKSQISFLTPAIAGIVVGISTMVVTIIVQLNQSITEMAGQGFETEELATSQLSTISSIFSVEGVIPSFYFQLVVGIYVVQIGLILIILYNSIENGADEINKSHLIGKLLKRSTITYILIAGITTVLFSMLAANIGGGLIS
ncbi:MAG TPA: hypothetical protein VJB89_02945 [Candidatus Nanoarchaeia archaeon]|nr:hypothetical protein [Candidatus Nanoarchaeia archaeon]